MTDTSSSVVSFFSSVKDTENPSLVKVKAVLDRIKSGTGISETIKSIRSSKNQKEKTKLKQKLPIVVFGGAFKTRSIDGLIESSSLMVLDFDHVEDYDLVWSSVVAKPYTVACFRSPSGDGIKAVIKIPLVDSDEEYKHYYYGAMVDFPDIDTSGKDISRASFMSYDPDIFINYNAIVFNKRRQNDPNKRKQLKQDPLEVAIQMIRYAEDGNKHETLLKAARLCGGYIAGGFLEEQEVVDCLFNEIRDRADDEAQAINTINDGIGYGKNLPIYEAAKIMRESTFTRGSNGDYDFLATEEDMDDYLYLYKEGKIELGLKTYMGDLDRYWRFKKNTFTLIAGLDNVGKSWLIWYLRVVAAVYHNEKTLIFSSENSDGTLKRKIFEFYRGKPIKDMTQSELADCNRFYREHFRIISSQRTIYDAKSMLDIGTEMYIREWKNFHCFVIEPYNSLKKPHDNSYQYDYDILSEFRLFSQRYCSVWIAAHVRSEAARRKDADGYVETPIKADIEGGQPFANRADDFIMFHRKTNHPELNNVGMINVMKIKETETGGSQTYKGEPVNIRATNDLCGFVALDTVKQKEIDVIRDYWEGRGVNIDKPKDPILELKYDDDIPF